MPKNEYHETIQTFQEKLESIKSQEDTPTGKIEEIQGNIQELLNSTDKEHEEIHGSMNTILEDAVNHFQISHPNLTALISTVINDLNAIGI